MASKSGPNTSQDEKTGDGKEFPSKKMTPEEQSARFIETARDLDCDDGKDAFEKAIKKILK